MPSLAIVPAREAITLLLWAAVITVAGLSVGVFLLHRLIKRQIQSLKEL